MSVKNKYKKACSLKGVLYSLIKAQMFLACIMLFSRICAKTKCLQKYFKSLKKRGPGEGETMFEG